VTLELLGVVAGEVRRLSLSNGVPKVVQPVVITTVQVVFQYVVRGFAVQKVQQGGVRPGLHGPVFVVQHVADDVADLDDGELGDFDPSDDLTDADN